MGAFTVSIRIFSPDGGAHRDLEALVVAGATFTMLPESVLIEFGHRPVELARFEPADGSTREYGVSYAQVTLGGSTWPVPVAFGPEETEILLGATALEIFRLRVDPVKGELAPVSLVLKKQVQESPDRSPDGSLAKETGWFPCNDARCENRVGKPEQEPVQGLRSAGGNLCVHRNCRDVPTLVTCGFPGDLRLEVVSGIWELNAVFLRQSVSMRPSGLWEVNREEFLVSTPVRNCSPLRGNLSWPPLRGRYQGSIPAVAGRLASYTHFPVQYEVRYLARGAPGETDQPPAVFPQDLLVHPGAVVEPLGVSLGAQGDEVPVAFVSRARRTRRMGLRSALSLLSRLPRAA